MSVSVGVASNVAVEADAVNGVISMTVFAGS